MSTSQDSKSSDSISVNNWYPSYGDLPMEIILHIFKYLGYADLQAAGGTCSRWRSALDETVLSAHTLVRFAKVGLSDQHSPAKDFISSDRRYRHYCLEEVSIGHVREMMTHIGASAHSLCFDNVDLSQNQFYVIMRLMQELRTLSVQRCSTLFMPGTFHDESRCKDLAENLINIKELILCDCQYLTDAILLRLTLLMPSIEALNMSGCPITFHNAIHTRFYPNEGVSAPSETVLTFKYILFVLLQHRSKLSELNFSHTLIGLSLRALSDFKLKRLYLAGCRQLIAPTIQSFLQTQPQLVVLDLSTTTCLNNDGLECLVKSNTMLEYLNISGCLGITNAGAIFLGQLKHLLRLDISCCDGVTTEGLTQGIAREENLTLRELNLSYLQICEECIKCVSRNLGELRVLNISHCVDGATDEAVQCIIQHLRWLRDLSMENCVRLTDASLTGINIAKLELNRSNTPKASLENFYPPLASSLAERDSYANSMQSMKISLRSKAEEEIVRDAKRKQAMFAAYEMNLIDDQDFEGFNIQALRGLNSLNIKGCNKITDVSLKYGLKHIELRRLLLSNCQQISLLGMDSLVLNCPSIEELDLSDCYNINDKTIQVATSKLRRLRALHISGCSQLTDHSLDAILVNCKCLQTLSVYRCRSMYTDIEERLSNLTTLRNLNMDNVASIDNVEFFRLKKRLDY